MLDLFAVYKFVSFYCRQMGKGSQFAQRREIGKAVGAAVMHKQVPVYGKAQFGDAATAGGTAALAYRSHPRGDCCQTLEAAALGTPLHPAGIAAAVHYAAAIEPLLL